MKSRVDEPEAEGPKDAAELLFSVPAESHEADFSQSLDDFFGRAPVPGDQAEGPASVASRDKLAELFRQTSAAEADSGAHPIPADDAPQPYEAEVDATMAEWPAAGVLIDDMDAAEEPAAGAWVDDMDAADEPAVDDDPAEVEPLIDESSSADPDSSDASTGTATEPSPAEPAAVEEPWVEELGLDVLLPHDTESGEPQPESVAAVAMAPAVPDEPSVYEPAAEESPGELPAHEPEPHFAASPLLAPAVVEPRTVTPMQPHKGTFGPASSRTGVRRVLFGSRARTAVSVIASVVLVAAIVGGAGYAAQSIAAQNRLVAAQTALEAAEAAIEGPATTLDTAFADYEASKVAARAMADETTPSLAAVAGMTDQSALDAANAALAELVAALDADGPPAAPAPYEPAAVTSDPDEVAGAAQSARDYADEVKARIRDVQAVTTGVKGKTAALTVALNALGASLPATAALIAGQYPLAEQSFRDAVVAAAVAVGAAQGAGGSGDAELLVYAAAVTALRADQERAVAEAADKVRTRPRTGTTNPVTPTTPAPTTPPPTPPAPSPSPSPTPTPTPTPSPDPTP